MLTRPDRPTELATLGVGGTWTTVRTSTRVAPDPATVSVARDVTWPGEGGVVHGWYYPPLNPGFAAPEGTRRR